MSKQLKVIFLGGIDEIGKNMTAIEYGGNIIVIDSGMTFPTEENPGVDVIIPDMTYLVENKDKIRALLLTHGHEDHIGAVPFLIRSIPEITIYGSKLTLALVEHKCRENSLDIPKLIAVEGGAVENIVCFKVEFIRVSHSISGAFALAIETPQGIVFHTGDYKIDYTPIDNNVVDLPRISEYGKKGVLLMMGESTNVEREGYTMSERTVGASFDRIFSQNIGRRIIIATFASNIHRLQQIIDVAVKYGRRVVLSGRSMINIGEMAMKIGELKCPPDLLVDIDKIGKIPYDKLVIVATGSQGEPMSALTRMSKGEYNKITINDKDTIIMSSSPIPGNERLIYNVINNLYRQGANVIYEGLEDVHVSGHACKEELKLMLTLIKPKYFIPVHGEYRHLKKHAILAESVGVKTGNIVIPDLGDVYEIRKSGIVKTGKVTAGNMFVDGLTIDDMSSMVLKDRKHLSEEGFIIVLLGISLENSVITTGPEIISRGMCSLDPFLDEMKKIVSDLFNSGKYKGNEQDLKSAIRKVLRKYIYTKVMHNPMILPIIMEN